ncbi:MAG: hypothetical protein ACO3Y3_04200 [Phycisphaerales bacterium]
MLFWATPVVYTLDIFPPGPWATLALFSPLAPFITAYAQVYGQVNKIVTGIGMWLAGIPGGIGVRRCPQVRSNHSALGRTSATSRFATGWSGSIRSVPASTR